MKRYLWILGMVMIWSMVGCGADRGELAVEDGSAADAELIVQLNDNYFGENPDSLPTWTVRTGDTVTLTLTNQGGLRHNWAIIEAEADVPTPFRESNRGHTDLLLFDSGKLSGGQNATAAFEAPLPGTYRIICTVAGHYPSMQGTLVVE